MKKILAFLMFFMVSPLVFAYQIKADTSIKRLPRGTKMHLASTEPVTTSNIQEGDMFSARLLNDIKNEGKTVLPSGTLIRGTVEKYSGTGLLSKSAVLYLTFDHIVTPQGRQIPLRAGICAGFDLTEDGAISGGGNYFSELKRNASKAGNMIAKSTEWGINSGDELFLGGRFLVTPVAAIFGTVAGGAYLVGDSIMDLFRKGNDVIIEQDKAFDVILLEALDVPAI